MKVWIILVCLLYLIKYGNVTIINVANKVIISKVFMSIVMVSAILVLAFKDIAIGSPPLYRFVAWMNFS